MARWKSIEFDYDWITSKDDINAIPVCLTWRERHILLSMLDIVGWQTRWSGTPSLDTIEAWRDELFSKLIGECAVDCDDVIACLIDALGGEGTDISVTLQDWIQENQGIIPPYPPVTGVAIDEVDTNLNSESCDSDTIFGFSIQLVQLFNALVENLFEIIEVATNGAELIAGAVDSIPLLSEVTDYIVYIQDSIYENYLANYDVALEKQIACDLFCLMQDNAPTCTLTWDDILVYLSLKTAYELSDVKITDWADFVVAGTWDGDEFVYIMFMTVAAVLAAGGDWAGITLQQVQNIVTSFFNDPDDDWITLCDTCAWIYTIDFTSEQGDWEVGTIFMAEYQGTYVSSTGWQTTWQNNGDDPGVPGHNDSTRALCIIYPLSLTGDTVINHCSAHYDLTNSGNWDGSAVLQRVDVNTGEATPNLATVSAPSDPTGTNKGLVFLGDQYLDSDAEYLRVSLFSGRLFENSDPGGQATLTSISFSGAGENPFE